ncbi:GntR family transcriptional regulator [Allokutzneria oryzae]|uniref:GntR family transcriptional regulator n=1 Tax=Allokutzneria oryzae TaxID=1378989 RepID=A0ABV5ZZG4_9PSEU
MARNIRNQISAGVLRDGQPLPSTRDMAEEWGVSVFTINEAMKTLAEQGLVTSKPRAGRVVTAPDQAYRNEIRGAQPQVLLIGGYAGSGKTELGRILARESGWPMLDKDTLTRPVVEAALETLGCSPNDRESETYISRIRPREYEALISATLENLQCGNSVIATAPFIREFGDRAWISRVQAQFSDLNANLSLVWVYCDMETMRTYIRQRGAARDASKIENWETYSSALNIDFRPAVDHVVIDNSSSGSPLQKQARDLVNSLPSAG